MSVALASPPPPTVTTDADVRSGFARDASGLELVPAAVARPTEAAEVRELLAWAARDGLSVTPAGGQSSTTGASITDAGLLLSLRGLDRILDLDVTARTVRVEPGVPLGALKRRLAADGLLFAPDPTSEDDCTVGGAIACNASGARSLRFGATRAHVRGLTVAMIDGTVLELRRPQLEKNTVGYAPVFDLVDWFVGSEGTLGVILAAELALLPLPAHVTGLAIPFSHETAALGFVAAAREAGTPAPRCLEYMDHAALAIARDAAADPGWAATAGGRRPRRRSSTPRSTATRPSTSTTGSRSPRRTAPTRTTSASTKGRRRCARLGACATRSRRP
ncbi:MAG: FAD-binding oxidoreductase [Gemmatimonadaceae bacterium]|nr:FAD-binding oxidoreductase [Gemmatimonadaceae bacterium]